MARPDASTALKVDGDLCWNPTDLSADFPHGGIALGFLKGHAYRSKQRVYRVRAEEYGNTPTEAIYTGAEPTIVAIISDWDTAALAVMFPDSTAGGTTARRILYRRVLEEDKRAGMKVSELAGKLYFSPRAPQHPGVYFPNAFPIEEEEGSVAFGNAEQFGKPMTFIGLPDATGRMEEVGLREDITL